ncbi:hypothetical protein SRB5_18370 [Streptomyces sp. RB5]|uniref:Gram-positive cocci surface proteins LPxTG domain-containing protein n=1 Tax=Streptomyces smaragdinus TaxID=2585196 RepID=A0A7K0CE19_9ACTN|nr:hypothetical protein [Streptomyces smaragdinus]MQY11718.1 hypothetical protein [Streptomyces smaragdinus]
MRTISMVSAASVLGVLTAGLAAPAAFAQGTDITSFGFTVSPKTVRPGGQVNLTATDCEHQARASSGVFDSVPLGMEGDPMQSASVTVDWDARPGAEYTVTFTCGPETGRTTMRIADTSSTSRPRPSPSGTTAKPTGTASPTGRAATPGTPKERPTTPAATPASPMVKDATPAAPRPASPRATATPTAAPTTTVTPVRPARGGLGGSQHDDPVLLASGTAVSSAAVLGGAFFLRRRRAAD